MLEIGNQLLAAWSRPTASGSERPYALLGSFTGILQVDSASRGRGDFAPLANHGGNSRTVPMVAITMNGTIRMMAVGRLPLAFSIAALLCAFAASVSAHAASDLGKKACAQEARQLCPAEMKTLRRKKVEACMIARINQTSPVCHSAMLKIKAQREVATPKP